jgi:hypothetical protein
MANFADSIPAIGSSGIFKRRTHVRHITDLPNLPDLDKKDEN